MKITTISKVASLVISSVMIQTAVAGHDVGIGVGPHSGGGGSGAGIFEMLFGGGARPTFGQPVIVRSASRMTANSRPQIASRIQQPSERAGNHIFSRQSASVHRDWARHTGRAAGT